MEQTYHYYAFISYNHRDEKVARWLQSHLEHYKLPSVARKEIGEDVKIRPVFRYVSDLGVAVLREKIKEELEASKHLIVVCSPHSANPNVKGEHWVNDEVKRFIALGRKERRKARVLLPRACRGGNCRGRLHERKEINMSSKNCRQVAWASPRHSYPAISRRSEEAASAFVLWCFAGFHFYGDCRSVCMGYAETCIIVFC